jgi:hypothetical protein
VSVLLNNGNGTLQAAFDVVTGAPNRSVAIGDVSGDGSPDLVAASPSAETNTVSVLRNMGSGTSYYPKVDYATGLYPFSVAIGDVNGDGKLDLVTANLDAKSVSVLLNSGDGTFQPNYATGVNPVSVTIVDLNGDGKRDVVTSNSGGTNSVSVLLGNGDAMLQGKADYGTGADPVSLAAGDLNGDGKPDLATRELHG